MNPQSRIQQAFAERKNALFIPFFSAGDPDLATTRALVEEAAQRGADLIEIGVPFSDPIADGPVIQASYFRALASGFRVEQVFELARQLRQGGLKTPLVCMVSETLVYKRGEDAFFSSLKQSGFDGVLIPDLPSGYEGSAAQSAARHGLDLIFLCAPTTTPERRDRITQTSTGFVYYISVTGITGARNAIPPDLAENVRDLKRRSATPVCVGFGISTPEQAAAVGRIADGVIVGSALVKKTAELAQQGLPRNELLKQLAGLLESLANAAHGKT